jgi:tRNA U34 5-methylaminomethyl-2-thiouridine-forming methyltransferase MnmC
VLGRGEHEDLRTRWRLVVGELPGTLAGEGAADVVFWDPYSPGRNPELWSVAAFTAVRRLCRVGTTLHTYSGATATRAALLLAGFAVGVGEATGGRARGDLRGAAGRGSGAAAGSAVAGAARAIVGAVPGGRAG